MHIGAAARAVDATKESQRAPPPAAHEVQLAFDADVAPDPADAYVPAAHSDPEQDD